LLRGSNVRMRATLLCMAGLIVTALAISSDTARADRGSPVADSCADALEARYFPVGTLEDGSIFRRWYSSYLAAMEELPLSCGPQEDMEAYRFLLLPSFHDAVAVRLFRRGNVYALEAVILDRTGMESYQRWLFQGTGDYRPGNVSRRVAKALSRDQWQAVITRLEEVQLWQMPTQSDALLRGTDGAEWMVEARREGRYHVVVRWSGAVGDGLKSVGRLFLDLAGLGAVY
jgi:hypothetical protein